MDPDSEYGSGSTDLMKSGSNTDPDPKFTVSTCVGGGEWRGDSGVDREGWRDGPAPVRRQEAGGQAARNTEDTGKTSQ